MENCKDCFHYASCKAWIQHGEALYSDFSYSTEDCPHYVSLVQCKDCKYYHTMEEGFQDCINTLGIDIPQRYDFCSYGERRTESFEEDLSDGALD